MFILTEDYCDFETAKLLKEKGFDEKCRASYNKDGNFLLHKNFYFQLECGDGYLAPTHQMACKWLRKVYNLHVDVGYDDLDWFWNIISISEDVPVADRPNVIVNGTACHRTYEEAVEEALKYALEKLI